MRTIIRNLFLLLFSFLIIPSGINGQNELKLDSINLEKLISVSKETYTDEFMLIHKGHVIHHWKNNDCDSIYFNTASMVKSWTGLVIGILIDQGLIKSEDDLICAYVPEWEEGCKHKVTIKNLLTMTAGFNRRSGARGILAEDNMNAYVVETKLDTTPNIRFAYSNESVQLLGILIEKITRKTANEYFKEVLFTPLGMDSTWLASDAAGNDVVFGGASTTLSDAAKIGMLMEGNGYFNNEIIVSEDWIKKSITPSEKAAFYGYLWWLDNNSDNKNYAATGDFGQMTIVFPDMDLIYLRQQSCNKDISGNMRWMGPAFLKLISGVLK